MIDAALLQGLPVIVTPLTISDMDDIMALEATCFALPWPRSAYRHELTQNANSYFLAIRPADGMPADLPHLLAYGGFWKLYEEAHICTIASHPGHRGRGLGEWLLLHLLDLAQSVGAEVATLEVRAGNATAQRMYRRTGFTRAGLRRRYYSNNGEDALIMTTPAMTLPEMQVLLKQRWEVVAAHLQSWGKGGAQP